MNRRFFGSAVIGAVASLLGIKTTKAAVEREEAAWVIEYDWGTHYHKAFYFNELQYIRHDDGSTLGGKEYVQFLLEKHDSLSYPVAKVTAYPVYK